jgi:hypothetical protein
MAQNEEEIEEFEGEVAEPSDRSGYETPYEGNIQASWMVNEYERYDRGPFWYGAACTIALGLLVWAIITQNFLFAVMILMFGVLIGLSALRHPRRVPVVLTDLGIGVGGRFWGWRELKSFWLIYDPPEIKMLYIGFRHSIVPHLALPLEDENPLPIREGLLRFLPEDLTKDEEPLSDWFSRLIKL